MDANLQWNRHPRKVILFTTHKEISYFMNRLMNMKSSSHSASHESSKPLCNKLQQVTSNNFDWENQNWYLVEFESGELTISQSNKILFFIGLVTQLHFLIEQFSHPLLDPYPKLTWPYCLF